jgi:hypothetical protein
MQQTYIMQANQEDSGMIGDYDVSDGIAEDVTDGRKTVTYLDDKKSTMRMMRRTKSVARAEEITKEAEKVRRSQPDKPYVCLQLVSLNILNKSIKFFLVDKVSQA